MEATELKKLEGKNWLATMMLCWFLGSWGAHRFYTGKTTSGWVMFILTITGCFAIVSYLWALWDGFMIAFGKYTHEDGSELYERINWVGWMYAIITILIIIVCILYFSLIFAVAAAGVSGAMQSAGSSMPPVAP